MTAFFRFAQIPQALDLTTGGAVVNDFTDRFTPQAKKVYELSLREALQLGHNYIGTEHILLALIREGEGVAAKALVHLGLELTKVRQQVLKELSNLNDRRVDPKLAAIQAQLDELQKTVTALVGDK